MRCGVSKSLFCFDGEKIAFSEGTEPFYNIFIMDEEGNRKNVTNYMAWNCEPAWSPDGTEIVFASDREGNFGIYVVDVDGTHVTKITNDDLHLFNEFEPSWCCSLPVSESHTAARKYLHIGLIASIIAAVVILAVGVFGDRGS